MFGQIGFKGSRQSRFAAPPPAKQDEKAKETPKPVAFSQQEKPAMQYLHAFVSLTSLDVLDVCEDKNVCEVKKEGGWNTDDYLKIHQALLQQVITAGNIQDENLLRFIKNHLQNAKLLVALNANPKLALDIINKLPVGNGFLFPWGTSNHQIYLDVSRTANNYRVRIFNLGGGLISSDIATNTTSPHELTFDNLEDLTRYLNNLAILNNITIHSPKDNPFVFVNEGEGPVKLSHNDFYTKYVYNGKRVSCGDLCPAEFIQSTGNCVVKNLLFALQQITLYFAQGNKKTSGQLYQQLFLEMVRASLELAKEYAPNRVVEFLGTGDWLCGQIANSQKTFLGVGCQALAPILKQFTKAPDAKSTATAATATGAAAAAQPTKQQSAQSKHGGFWTDQKEPEHVSIFKSAMAALKQGDYSTALYKFGDLLAHPDHFQKSNAGILYSCGICNYNLDNYDAALSCFNDSFTLDPTNEDCFNHLVATQNLIESMQAMQSFNPYQNGPS